ncbi:unnamed protein product [Cylindrotheca closterium]|uniref:Uncharacterized protein n=1 Tax=Cylindrotheca closterium TaxID=2856 RepID=A0AAD2CBS8_9STRA|nr:unnamed protein product [Cylindrotheca closterium]
MQAEFVPAGLDDFWSDVMAPGSSGQWQRGLAAPRPEVFNTDDFFNREPPSNIVTFIIGGVLWILSFGVFLQRVHKLKTRTEGQLKGYDLYRGLIGCAMDNDSPFYTIISFASISFLFLGGVQTDYRTTLIVMMAYYAIVSFGESLRVLMAYWSYKSLSEVFLFTEMDAGLKEKQKEDKDEKDRKFETMEVQPNNIYEDMGREKTIVIMIFLTQIILVSFVCVDIYRAETVRCMDGTANCPVGGTMGSYGFYLMGIFQACVYLLGPKTNFGQSEQNPGFWLILLLASKKNGARLLWENPIKDPAFSKNPGTLRDQNGNYILDATGNPKLWHQKMLNQGDFTMWRRFFMSYLVNGVAFHILVHALPIQVASQSSFTGVVFRAVGMLYLVDLDDSKGFRLIITEKDEENEPNKKPEGEGPIEPSEKKDDDEEEMRPPGKHTPMKVDSTGAVTPFQPLEENQQAQVDENAMAAQANEILEEAQTKLEMLRQNGPSSSNLAAVGGGLGRESRLTSARMNRPSRPIDVSTRLNIGFGCTAPTAGGGLTGTGIGQVGKKNTGQAALLQASEGLGPGGAGGPSGGTPTNDGGGGAAAAAPAPAADAGGDGGGGGGGGE